MNFQDIERSKLRVIVAEIDNQIPALSTQMSAAGEPAVAARFAVSWAALVELLALGPEPEVRRCPICMATIQQNRNALHALLEAVVGRRRAVGSARHLASCAPRSVDAAPARQTRFPPLHLAS